MHVLNIYAPSGSRFLQEREQLFKQDIVYYLRNNLSNTIMCGDFNCILNQRDKSKNGSCPVSKGLSSTVNNIGLKDIWNLLRDETEFTYFRNNYGSRLDRIYATDFKNNITNILTKPISFSDHHGVIIDISLNNNIEMGRFYWKLNTKLLEDEYIEIDFRNAWAKMLTNKNEYENVNEWWEKSAKVNICNFFKKKGRQESKLQQGLLEYLELKLNRLYRDFHKDGNLVLAETKELKAKINIIKEQIMEGVAIRARIKEQTEGEQASSSLIGKQNANRIKPKICKIKTEYSDDSCPNVVLNSQESISKYVSSYYQSLYDETVTDKGKQDWFLSFVDNCVSENDNNALIAQISDEEIFFTLKSFNNNKSHGIESLPVEFYISFSL